MDKKLTISLALTIAVFVLTVLLFGVVVIDLNVQRSHSASSTPVASSAPKQEETALPGQKIFKTNCSPCHRIDQKLIGPALAGVFERRDSLWVIAMIRNSSQLIASGDPTAVKLFREYNGVQMTSFTSFSDEELKSLLEYIRFESAREDNNPWPAPAPSRAEV
jgi:mono/diheme cytochrome c family protein